MFCILVEENYISIMGHNFYININFKNQYNITETFKKENTYQKDINIIKNKLNENISNEINNLLNLFPISKNKTINNNSYIKHLSKKLQIIKRILQRIEPFIKEQQQTIYY